MKVLSPSLRRQLERTVGDAREVAETGARGAVQALAVHHHEPWEHMGAEGRTVRCRLRAHGRQLGDRRDPHSGNQAIDRLVHEYAYEHWHGMLFARFLAENNLLIEPELGIAVTLEDCEKLGEEAGDDKWTVAARFAHRMLPQVFRPDHPVFWDGRRRDGFHALVSYHKLAEGAGRGRRLLESLTYSYLGDWISRQQDGVQRDEAGADDRLAAAKELEKRLAAIIEGEPPYDIFVRWKPLHEQPIGWEPDINDGVRLNIRPFMADDIRGGRKGAGILRAKPNVHWRKDRGKEPLTRGKRSKPPWLQDEAWDPDDDRELRPQQDYPWFWRGGEFTGDRVNDVHLAAMDKRRAGGGADR